MFTPSATRVNCPVTCSGDSPTRRALDDRAGVEGWFDAYRESVKHHRPQRGKRLPDEHFEQVADVYRAATFARQNPTRAVSDAFAAKYSTAARWVMVAREKGFLGPAPAPGLPGEKGNNHA